MTEAQDISLGEVARRVDRMETEMRAGFLGLHEQMARLAFVPAGVYAADRTADREWITRLERELDEETARRETAEQRAEQRGWQTRFAITLAILGVPLSIIGSLALAIVTKQT